MEQGHYRLLLLEEFAVRRRRNSAYSLQAFSRSLGLSAPTLSQVLSGKRPLSRKAAKKIIERCPLSDAKRQLFLQSALGLFVSKAPTPVEELEIETFKVIADWYHYAILSLGALDSNHHDPEWIAGQLQISVSEARNAFQRLKKLGLVAQQGRGFRQSSRPLAFPTTSRDAALRRHHHQLLDKAKEVLDSEAVALELFSTMTMAVDESKLGEARTVIKEFRRKICQLLEGGKADRVYTLAVQLIPLSKKRGKGV